MLNAAKILVDRNNSQSRNKPQRKTRPYFLVLALYAASLFLIDLGKHDLWSPDEPRVAGIAAEMLREGDLVVPRLNGAPFLEKPPLHFWIAAATFNLMGETEYAARLPSALTGFFGVLLTFFLARRMGYSSLSAFLAGLVLATAGSYWILAHRGIVDMTLCFFILGAMASYYQALCRDGQRTMAWWSIAFILFLSCAVLTKGLVGLAIPLSALSVWLVLAHRSSLRSWSLLFAGSVICLVPCAIWIGFLYRHLGWDGVYEVVWTNNFGRFTGSTASHNHSFHYYLINFPLEFLPWTLFIPYAAMHCFKKTRGKKPDEAALFMMTWFVVPFVVLSVASGKRGLYLLPIYPAAALLVGTALGSILEENTTPGRWFGIPYRLLLGLLVIAGLAYGTVGFYFEQPLPICALLTFPGICLGVWAIRRYSKQELSGSFRWAAAALFVLLFTCGYGVYPLFDGVKSFVPLLQCYERYSAAGARINLFEPPEALRGAAVFYLKRNVPELQGERALKRFLKSGKDAMAVCADKRVAGMEGLSIQQTFDIGHRIYLLVKKSIPQTEDVTGEQGG
ncbi:MAG: glycosyltransferase family 39 protein [Planctomycetes bacterium]|nr:glycosyltransferase family 39 protein [Planctomycetota bacterium]